MFSSELEEPASIDVLSFILKSLLPSFDLTEGLRHTSLRLIIFSTSLLMTPFLNDCY
jgi:hypothetical protein